jgi:hypothetical protein
MLDHKARLARQYDAVEAVIKAGPSPAQVVSLTPENLERVDHVDSETEDAESQIHISVGDAFGVSVDAEPIDECIEMATKESCLTGDDDPPFRTLEGDPIDESMFDLLRRRTRSGKINVNGQRTVCEALNESRRKMLGRADWAVVNTRSVTTYLTLYDLCSFESVIRG